MGMCGCTWKYYRPLYLPAQPPWATVLKGQRFMIKNVHLDKCIHVAHDRATLAECNPYSQEQHWSWVSGTIISATRKKCLGVDKVHKFASVKLAPCGDNAWQAWSCTKKGHLTLNGQGLHLNAKHGTNKIFVSLEKGKFSKWKTLSNEPICTSGAADGGRHGQIEVVELAETPVLFYETEVISTSEQMNAQSRSSWIDPISIQPPEPNSTSLESQTLNLAGEDGNQHPLASSLKCANLKHHSLTGRYICMLKFGKGPIPPDKTSFFRQLDSGTNWKLGMLILSPLAFTIGLLILVLNVHCNKKRKKLCAPKSYPQTWHGANGAEELAPLSLKVSPAQHCGLASRSPSLRHGEILIEWKDGTITPLFDNFSYQTD